MGKSTLFNRMTGSRRAIVAPIAGTTRDSLARSGRLARRVAFSCLIPGACTAPARIRCTSSSSGRASAPSPAPICWCSSSTAVRASSPATRPSHASCVQTGKPLAACHQQDRRQARPRRRPRTSTSSASTRSSRFPPSTERASAELLDEIVERLGLRALETDARRGDDGPEPGPPTTSDAGRDHGRHRRAAERRQVVAASIACCTKSACMVSDMPGTTRDAIDSVLTWHRRRFRIVDTAGMRRPGRVAQRRAGRVGQRRRREESDRRRRCRRPRDRRERRARPNRTRRSAEKPIAPAAASSSSRTNGTW